MRFSEIAIIYNPISTGPGKAMAEELAAKIRAANPEQNLTLRKTEYPRHGETMAYEIAKASPTPLVVTASGDGGYNEVVNGLMRAQAEGAQPTAGLLPSGNANDHFKDVYQEDIFSSIVEGKVQYVDLLTLQASQDGKPFSRYAHSYIGFGLTPQVGKELNKKSLNRLNEIWIVVKHLFTMHPVRLEMDGKVQSIESLVFSNVAKMSKVLQLSEDAKNDDGMFEMTLIPRRTKMQLIRKLLHSAVVSPKDVPRFHAYTLKTIKPTLTQLDGEVQRLDANCTVEIGIKKQQLTCLQ